MSVKVASVSWIADVRHCPVLPTSVSWSHRVSQPADLLGFGQLRVDSRKLGGPLWADRLLSVLVPHRAWLPRAATLTSSVHCFARLESSVFFGRVSCVWSFKRWRIVFFILGSDGH